MIKKSYFVEKTQSIEDSSIKVKTLFVDKDKARSTFNKLFQQPLSSFGLILSEYKIKAEENYFLFLSVIETMVSFTC